MSETDNESLNSYSSVSESEEEIPGESFWIVKDPNWDEFDAPYTHSSESESEEDEYESEASEAEERDECEVLSGGRNAMYEGYKLRNRHVPVRA
jgi:hypothetical protein